MSNDHSRIDRTASTLPAINDMVAVAVLALVYFIRLASVTTEAAPLPWWLTATTDALIPALAALWLFGGATYALIRRS